MGNNGKRRIAMSKSISAKKGVTLDIRLSLTGDLADKIRETARDNDRTLPAEIGRALRKFYLEETVNAATG